jgi:hypothetical protein
MNSIKPTARIATGSDKRLIDTLLSMNTNNRRIKTRHVAYLRNEIRSGKWSLTNQGVGVTVDDVLCDGQHRLEAIKAEGYPPVEFVLVTGLPEEAGRYVDLHVKRTSADILTMLFDLPLAGRTTSAITAWLRAKENKWSYKFSPSDLIAAYEIIGDSIAFVFSVEKSQRLPAPAVAAIAESYRDTQDERLIDFLNQLIGGEMLKAGDPAFALRASLTSQKGTSGGADAQRIRYFKTTYAVKAFLEGRSISRLYSIEK